MIPALNRDGDCLSDLVLQLFGTIAGAESLLLGFGDDSRPHRGDGRGAARTAPSLQGKNVANPMAMILAAAALLGFATDERCRAAAIRDAVFEVLRAGVATADLGGDASTSAFTDAVVERIRARLATA